MRAHPAGLLGGLFCAAAGTVHLWHSASQHGIEQGFFVVIGIFQVLIALGLACGIRQARWPALGLNGGLIGLYLATHLPMLGRLAEPIDQKGLFTKAFEVLAIFSVVWLLRRPYHPDDKSASGGLRFSRRSLLQMGSVGAASMVAGGALSRVATAQDHSHGGLPIGRSSKRNGHGLDSHFGNISVGDVDLSRFNPSQYLTDFDYGKVSKLPDGRTLREFEITAVDVEIEVAPGVKFAAWAYNGKVPGPTIRAIEGDLVRIHFTNAGAHPHTMHFHGFHTSGMDGVFEMVNKGDDFTYEFVAEPFGLHLYHCHTPPLKRHIHKGLYGVFIVDPAAGRPPAREMVMMMNAFDTNFDGGNEVYAVNTVAHHYLRHPIKIKRNELVRIYVVNITEFDPVNSFHSHATFFNEYRTGTKLEPDNFTDTIVLGQGERSILELTYKDPGRYMFHAHVSEFTELGWAGMFEVSP